MKFGWRGALGILLSVLLLAYTLRDVNFGDVARALGASSIPLFLLSAIVGTLIFPLRARRWKTILSPIDDQIPFGPLWRSTAIGMMVNNVVPARAGEIARAFALSREWPSIPFSASFASLAVDRLFDAFVVISLMLLAMLDPAFPRGERVAGQLVSHWVAWGALAAALFLVIVYLLVFFPQQIVTLYEAFARRVAPRLEQRGKDVLLAFASGLSVLRSPRRFIAVLGWTIAHWVLNALAWWIACAAVGIDVPFSGMFVLQGLIAIGVAIPSAPGFFGVFEALGREGLGLYGVDPTLAVTWAIGFHLLSFIPITVIGAYYFVRLGLHFRDLGRASEPAA
ncbi:MAG TPA: lysylphosphatidylglycerol synthase transmembrane domain-containing protein [Gemmatimonadaceae bacterium]|nr:lysylphosphatidylglycerol synthase transmembrane domain-containing protein [Gemmatimonadaceae bacterium]